MKKYFIFLLIMLIFSSCTKVEKDDSYKFTYYKLQEVIKRDLDNSEFTYLKNYHEIKNDSAKRIRFDSMHKISKNIQEKFYQLKFSNRNLPIKFRDSIVEKYNLPLKDIFDNDDLKLNDSVFKQKMEFDILNVRECYHYMLIYDRKTPL